MNKLLITRVPNVDSLFRFLFVVTRDMFCAVKEKEREIQIVLFLFCYFDTHKVCRCRDMVVYV